MHFTIVIQLVIENICTCVQGIFRKTENYFFYYQKHLRGKEGKKWSQEIGIIIQVGKKQKELYIYIYIVLPKILEKLKHYKSRLFRNRTKAPLTKSPQY